MWFDKKAGKVETLIVRHVQLVEKVVEKGEALIEHYLDEDKRFKEGAGLIDELEHEADAVRLEIERLLGEGAFLPVYREDYIVLTELVDKVANRVEETADFVALTRPEVPDFLHDDLRQMARLTRAMVTLMREALEAFLRDMQTTADSAKEIRKREQEVDRILWDSMKTLFKSDLDLARKLHVKALIDHLGSISNRIEDVADRLQLMTVKRLM